MTKTKKFLLTGALAALMLSSAGVATATVVANHSFPTAITASAEKVITKNDLFDMMENDCYFNNNVGANIIFPGDAAYHSIKFQNLQGTVWEYHKKNMTEPEVYTTNASFDYVMTDNSNGKKLYIKLNEDKDKIIKIKENKYVSIVSLQDTSAEISSADLMSKLEGFYKGSTFGFLADGSTLTITINGWTRDVVKEFKKAAYISQTEIMTMTDSDLCIKIKIDENGNPASVTYGETATPVHEANPNKWIVEGTQHYNPCYMGWCTEASHMSAKNNHTYNKQVANEKYLNTEATCQAKATYFKSCECGEKGTDTFEYGTKESHNWSTTYSSDDSNHWFTCQNQGCNEKNITAHSYSRKIANENYLNTEATCQAKATYFKSCKCGAKGTETFEYGEKDPANHARTKTTWNKIDEKTHEEIYDCCGAVKTDSKPHNFSNNAVACDICGAKNPDHIPACLYVIKVLIAKLISLLIVFL